MFNVRATWKAKWNARPNLNRLDGRFFVCAQTVIRAWCGPLDGFTFAAAAAAAAALLALGRACQTCKRTEIATVHCINNKRVQSNVLMLRRGPGSVWMCCDAMYCRMHRPHSIPMMTLVYNACVRALKKPLPRVICWSR